MAKRPARTVGLTQHAGFQIGVRRTLPLDAEEAWELLTSRALVRRWLGAGPAFRIEKGATYRLDDGSTGEVHAVSGSHLRLTRSVKGREKAATIQLRVLDKGDAAVVAFHEENLSSAKEREERRRHFAAVLDEVEGML